MTEALQTLPDRSSPLTKRIAAFIMVELRKEGLRETVAIELHEAARTGRPGARGEPVQSWHKVDEPGLFTTERALELGAAIVAYAENACEGPGQRRFTVACVNRADGRARMSITVDGPDFTGADFEDPNLAAIVSQQMRHIEVLLRSQLQTANNTNEMLERQLELANDRIIALEKMRVEHFDERERMLSDQNDRDLAAMKAAGSEKRMDAGFEKILALAPAVVNRLAGKKLLDEKQTPKEQMLGELAKGLASDPTRLRAILDALSTKLRAEEMILLAELLREAQPDESPNGVH